VKQEQEKEQEQEAVSIRDSITNKDPPNAHPAKRKSSSTTNPKSIGIIVVV
jgi:hypothetical protein